jgi:hypothetical protein
VAASPIGGKSGSYVWTHPSCPIRILLDFDMIERLRSEVQEVQRTSSAKREIGGLLIARRRSNPGTVKIVDFIPLPDDPNVADPHFRLASEWVVEAVGRCPSDSQVVGYFRTDLEQRIHLRPDDLKTIQLCFPHPSSIFLVIASLLSTTVTTTTAATNLSPRAGFFCYVNGSLATNPGLTFPLSAARLISDGWPRQEDAGKDNRLGRLSWLVAGMAGGGGSVSIKTAVLSGVTALLLAAWLLTWNSSAKPSRTPVHAHLGLQVRRGGTVSESVLSVSPGSSAPGLPPQQAVSPPGAGASPSQPTPPARPPLLSFKPAERRFVPPERETRSEVASDAVSNLVMPDPPQITPPQITPHKIVPLLLPPPSSAAPPVQPSEVTPASPGKQSSPGVIDITSEPSGAKVEINSVPVGVTPLTLQVNPLGLGFTVTVTKDGFYTWMVQSVATVKPEALHARLTATPKQVLEVGR